MADYKRRQLLIDRKFQIIFILKFCSLLLIGAAFTVAIMYILSQTSTSVFFENSRIVVKNTAQLMTPVLIRTSIVVTATVGIIAVVLLLFSSHKISGPLFRLKREIDKLAEGNIPKDFKIRSKDQLQGIADSFDRMVRELNLTISELKTSWTDLKNEFPDIIEKSGQDSKGIQSRIEEIDKRLERLNT